MLVSYDNIIQELQLGGPDQLDTEHTGIKQDGAVGRRRHLNQQTRMGQLSYLHGQSPL
jgi:hypothetical protein